MRPTLFAATLIAATFVTCNGAFAQVQDWAFVQSVGGLAVDAPVKKGGSWLLPIRADVSGVRASTTKPTKLNSALGCSIKTRIEDQSIFVTVVTAPGLSAACPAGDLGPLPKGRYTVFYSGSANERVRLRDIEIAL
jgi:hypothetical protein